MTLEYSNIIIKDGELITPIHVSIHEPEISELGDYICRLEFEGLGHSFKKEIFGVSPQQALLLAIQRANFLILNSDEQQEKRLFCILSDKSTAMLEPQMIGSTEG